MPQLNLLWFFLKFLLAWLLITIFSFSLLKQKWFSSHYTDNSEKVSNNKQEQNQQEWEW